MKENDAWSRVREDWEVVWVKPSAKLEPDEPPFPHTYLVTRSESLQLLLRKNVSEQQITKELVGLLQAINVGRSRHPTSWGLPAALERLGGHLLILASGGLALMNERLLEIPIVLVGLAWMLLGYSVLVVSGATVQAPARVR